MPELCKRAKIEAELGRSLESFLRERLARGSTPNSISREIGLDPSTIRHYIRKFKIPYQFGTKFMALMKGHVDICKCPGCGVPNCQEKKRIHTLGRCVAICLDFEYQDL